MNAICKDCLVNKMCISDEISSIRWGNKMPVWKPSLG